MNNISKVFDCEKNKNILNQCKISYNEDNSKILNGSNETNVKIYYSQKGEKIHDLKEHNYQNQYISTYAESYQEPIFYYH